MKCPACPTISLMMTERSGIEIDYCPECRGVWLDRGELDKIIERATPFAAPVPAPAPPMPHTPLAPPMPYPADPRTSRPIRDRDFDDDDHDDDDDRRRYYEHDGRPAGKRRKKNFLSELFDL